MGLCSKSKRNFGEIKMSRWENENVKELNLPDPLVLQVEYINTSGQSIKDQNGSVAKIQTVDNKSNYYVKFGRGEIFDPYGIDKNKISTFQFRKVSESVYKNYIEYLKSRREVFLTRARRNLKEGL